MRTRRAHVHKMVVDASNSCAETMEKECGQYAKHMKLSKYKTELCVTTDMGRLLAPLCELSVPPY